MASISSCAFKQAIRITAIEKRATVEEVKVYNHVCVWQDSSQQDWRRWWMVKCLARHDLVPPPITGLQRCTVDSTWAFVSRMNSKHVPYKHALFLLMEHLTKWRAISCDAAVSLGATFRLDTLLLLTQIESSARKVACRWWNLRLHTNVPYVPCSRSKRNKTWIWSLHDNICRI